MERSEPGEEIRSRHNRWVKWVRSLGSKEERRRQGLTVLEGRVLIEEALTAGVPLPLVMFRPSWGQDPAGLRLLQRLERTGARLLGVSQEALDACAQTNTPPGILAVARWREVPFAMASATAPAGELARATGVLVLLAGVQDPGNVGTVIRGAVAAGARGLLLGPGTAEVSSPKTLRATMGTAFRMNCWRLQGWNAVLALKRCGWRLVAAEVKGGKEPFAVPLSSGAILALGAEAHGLPAELSVLADDRVSIPMPGGAESLNVAMAATILLYEGVRQRWQGDAPGA
ncbi:MAG TPA: RNA methyltransferase [Firmicutes bacterium]|nr:RNA methyltransferase [Bacillota bacterium]